MVISGRLKSYNKKLELKIKFTICTTFFFFLEKNKNQIHYLHHISLTRHIKPHSSIHTITEINEVHEVYACCTLKEPVDFLGPTTSQQHTGCTPAKLICSAARKVYCFEGARRNDVVRNEIHLVKWCYVPSDSNEVTHCGLVAFDM